MVGGARDLWAQIIADVCELPVIRSSVTQTSCMGSMMLGGIGAGLYHDAADAVARMRVRRGLTEP